MTPRRMQVILDRYQGYLYSWALMTDENAEVKSTYAELAAAVGLQKQSIGPALRRMQELGMISDLVAHSANGTRFRVVPRTG